MKDSVLIPGAATFWRTAVPSIEIALPLTANGRPASQFAYSIFMLFAGVTMALLSLAFVGRVILDTSLLNRILAGLGAPCGLYAAVMFIQAGVRSIASVSASNPALLIDRRGLTDRRSGFFIEWADVAAARPASFQGLWGVTLELRDTSRLTRNAFWYGFPPLARKRNEVHIQAILMDVDVRHIVLVILTLVKLAGGTVRSSKLPVQQQRLSPVSAP